ncbi:Crp/Fnr family transcriptional regulator [Gracilibacillus sp. HCP3S3_G5_1]|uniref:Crp/Fnr family transcriptional regulator n=1 Tax=unclassified Gracilibacillus TaxID=2625209 RepID=UPI003F888D8B
MKEILLKYINQFTSLSEEEQKRIIDDLLTQKYTKGTILLRQGEVPTRCYFVLKGCVRQYALDEEGNEVTTNFFTEEQAIVPRVNRASVFTYTCMEDTELVIGDYEQETNMYDRYTQLESMTRKMTEDNLNQLQNDFAGFISSTPEERFKSLLQERPDLIHRVPQHQLASYLGITPESLSRIKKRIVAK